MEIRKLKVNKGDEKVIKRAYKDIFLFFSEAHKAYEVEKNSNMDVNIYLEFMRHFKRVYTRSNRVITTVKYQFP